MNLLQVVNAGGGTITGIIAEALVPFQLVRLAPAELVLHTSLYPLPGSNGAVPGTLGERYSSSLADSHLPVHTAESPAGICSPRLVPLLLLLAHRPAP